MQIIGTRMGARVLTRFFWYLRLPLIGILSAAMLFSPPALGLEIITSIKPLQLITLALAAPTDRVQTLIPDGASPHTYHLKPSDLRRLAAADILIWVGEDLEGKLTKRAKGRPQDLALAAALVDEIRQHAAPRVSANGAEDETEDSGADESKEQGHAHADESKEQGHAHASDPHFWLSPQLVALAAEHIHAELGRRAPAQKAIYAANLARFQAQLGELQKELEQRLAPVKQRGFITTHAAYAHFAAAFDLNYVGYILVAPESGYSAAHLAKLRRQLKQKKAICLLREPQLSDRGATSLSRGLDVQLGVLDPLASNVEETPGGYAIFLSALVAELIDCLA